MAEGLRIDDMHEPRQTGQKKTTWVSASWVMLADVVGTSVLTFDFVAKQVGWLLLVVFVTAFCFLAVYLAVLMSRTQRLLQQQGLSAASMGEVAGHSLGGPWAASAVFFLVYGYTFLGNSTYLLVIAQSLQGVFYDLHLSLEFCVGIAAAFCFPFICTVRRIGESTALCFWNLLIILAVLVIVLAALWHSGRAADTESPALARGLTFLNFFGASTNMLYAFAGHWLYFEIMAEMDKPETFPKVFLLNAPLQLLIYLGTGCVAYYFVGEAAGNSGLVEAMPRGFWYRLASGLLFAHVAIVFLVKTIVIIRFCHGRVAPRSLDERTFRGWAIHSACGLGLLLASCVVSLVVPSFDLILALIGGLFAAPINFLFPLLFYVGTLGRVQRGESQPGSGLGSFKPKNLRSELRCHHSALFLLIGGLIAFVSVVGSVSVIQQIMRDSTSGMVLAGIHLWETRGS